MHKEYKMLKKNKNNKVKRSETVKAKEQEWKNNLDQLFDIAHARALEDIGIAEDRAFLIAQREKGCRGKMGNVDKHLAKQEKKAYEREQNFLKKLEKEQKESSAREETITLICSSSESDEEYAGIADKPCCSTASLAKRARPGRGRKQVLNDKLAMTLDMAKVSDRNANPYTHSIAATPRS